MIIRYSIIAISLLTLLSTCQKPERDNPWDELNKLSPEDWAPKNLEIVALNPDLIEITWSYEDRNIEGFKVDRKINDQSWELEYYLFDKSFSSFTDTLIDIANNDFFYRVYAYAGNKSSIKVEANFRLEIGSFAFGGLVFYIDVNGNGFVCAESNQGLSKWGCFGSLIDNTESGISSGANNTASIILKCKEAGIAANICNDLVLNGYNDWFLPSKDELNLIYQNLALAGIGDFSTSGYWSSTEYSQYFGWYQYFVNGSQTYYPKDLELQVIAIRAF
jgi:hypothetical protein